MIEHLTGDQLLDQTDNDPVIRTVVRGGRITGPAWSGYGAWSWQGVHRGEPAITGIGSPAGAARIFEATVDERPDLRHASLPRGWLTHVTSVPVEHRAEWDWFWTEKAPEARPQSHLATWLSPDEGDDVRALLEQAMPDAVAWPGDARVRRWAGIRDGSNRLVACAADTAHSPLIGHLSSVATAPDQRRKGYGGALIAWVTRQCLDEDAEMMTLGMYADNTAGRRLYGPLGYTCEHQFTSTSVDLREAPTPQTR